jgi:hypothetical protein
MLENYPSRRILVELSPILHALMEPTTPSLPSDTESIRLDCSISSSKTLGVLAGEKMATCASKLPWMLEATLKEFVVSSSLLLGPPPWLSPNDRPL